MVRKPLPLFFTLLLLFSTTSSTQEPESTPTYPCPQPAPATNPGSSSSPPDLTPHLPEQFMLHVEANLVHERRTLEAIQVYDYPNQRAAISTTSQNETVTSIFSYKTGERLDILSNGTCRTHNLTDAAFDVFGFTELKASGSSQILPAAGVFRLGGDTKRVYLGEETVRGIPVYHWQSCQNLQAPDGTIKAAYVLDFFFSKSDYATATAETMIPIRALLNGTAINVDANGKPSGGTHAFSHVYDFSFFRPGPIEDESLFEVPRGTVCKRRLSKTLPQLPDQFSLSMEVQVGGSETPPRTERMLFDYGFGLIQTERFAPRGTGQRFGLTELKIVEDYNNHLQYVVDSYDGNCTISPLPDGLSTSEGGEGSQITMKHAQELLRYGQRDFTYQGQRMLRDMKVDVWADSTEEGMVQEVYFLANWPTPRLRSKLQNIASDLDLSRMNMLVGTYLLNTSAIHGPLGPFFQLFQDKALKQWGPRWQRQSFMAKVHDSSSSSPSSLSSSSSSLPRPGDLLRFKMARRRFRWDSARMHFPHASEKIINIFNYIPMHMDLSAFDVSMCYKKKAQERYVLFSVEGGYASVVTDQRSIFLSAVRSTVANAAGISMLRVTNVNVWQDLVSGRLNIFFYLLDPPPVFDKVPKQLSSTDALKNLQDAVGKGLTITVKHALKSHRLRVVPDSLKNWNSLADLWNKVLPGSKGAKPAATGGGSGALISDDSSGTSNQQGHGDSGSSGYTAGQFGGMAFAMLVVGVLVGVVGLYLVLRRLRPDIHFLPYQQTK